MADGTAIQGDCAAGFDGVRDVFAGAFESGAEVGAAVCVTVEGETVVDLWGGHFDREQSRPWERDSLVNVFSTSKGMTALAAHRLIDEGRLDIDAPVAVAAGGCARIHQSIEFAGQNHLLGPAFGQ